MKRQIKLLQSVVVVSMSLAAIGLVSGAQGLTSNSSSQDIQSVVAEQPAFSLESVDVKGGAQTVATLSGDGTFFAVNTSLRAGASFTIELALQHTGAVHTSGELSAVVPEGFLLTAWTIDPLTGRHEEAAALPSGAWLFNLPQASLEPAVSRLFIQVTATLAARSGKTDLAFELKPFQPAGQSSAHLQDEEPQQQEPVALPAPAVESEESSTIQPAESTRAPLV